jgi:hypothetical protein
MAGGRMTVERKPQDIALWQTRILRGGHPLVVPCGKVQNPVIRRQAVRQGC